MEHECTKVAKLKSVKCFQNSAAEVPDVVKLPRSDPLIALVVALRIVGDCSDAAATSFYNVADRMLATEWVPGPATPLN